MGHIVKVELKAQMGLDILVLYNYYVHNVTNHVLHNIYIYILGKLGK